MTESAINRFDELTLEQADRITEVLRPFVSEKRQERIDAALCERTRDVVVVLEDIYDPHNASAVLRTAEAIGLIEGHVIQKTYPFRISRKISIGSHKWLDLRRHKNAREAYNDLKGRGYEVWASAATGVPLSKIAPDKKVALVFGNEHQGLSEEAKEAADGCFWIPMTGFVESLNISVAAAISLYSAVDARRKAGLLQGLEEEEIRRLRAAWYANSVRAAQRLLAAGGLPWVVMARDPIHLLDDVEDDE